MNALAKIPMLTVFADAPMWCDVAEDKQFRREVYVAMLRVDVASAPHARYLKDPESIWRDVEFELRYTASPPEKMELYEKRLTTQRHGDEVHLR